MTPDTTRLNKYLALQLGISRREADEHIAKGSVTINGAPVALGARMKPGDVVAVDGKPLASEQVAYTYLAMNKPVGYVCSRRAQGDHPTIYSVIPKKYHHLKPVGRLDQNSSGLLLLTNDGDFAYRMTHPKFAKTKVYYVSLGQELQPLHQQMISDYGIQLDDGYSRLLLARRSDTNRSDWQVTMSEGRNRQIRRTFAALGYEVTQLHRVQFGDYALGELKLGEITVVN